MQVKKLADAQEKLAESKAPEALIRGTAAAHSAISQFQRGSDKRDNAAAAIVQAAKEQAERDKEQIRELGKIEKGVNWFQNINKMGL